MTTHDLGRSWQTPPTDLPDSIADNFDFHAVAVEGRNVWVAGSPGTRIFHSPDDGKLGKPFPPARPRRFARSRSSTPTTVGPPATSATSWPHTTAAAPGKRSAPAASDRAPRCFRRTDRCAAGTTRRPGAADGYIAAVDILCSPPSDGPSTVRACDERALAGSDAPRRRRFGRHILAIPTSGRRSRTRARRFAAGAQSRKRRPRTPATRKPPRPRAAHVAARRRRHTSRASGWIEVAAATSPQCAPRISPDVSMARIEQLVAKPSLRPPIPRSIPSSQPTSVSPRGK